MHDIWFEPEAGLEFRAEGKIPREIGLEWEIVMFEHKHQGIPF